MTNHGTTDAGYSELGGFAERTGPADRASAERSPAGWVGWRRFLRMLAVTYVSVAATLIVIGQILKHALAGSALIRWDDRVEVLFADGRSLFWNSVSKWTTKMADAPTIVALGVVVALVLAITRHRREIGLLAIALVFELGTFLTISYSVHRRRPTAPHLGSTPSTGSFPSGHVAATIVLFGFIALLLRHLGAARVWQVLSIAWVCVAAVAVGWSRMYRGQHHPIDVAFGALMGLAVLAPFALAMRPVPLPASATHRRAVPNHDERTRS